PLADEDLGVATVRGFLRAGEDAVGRLGHMVHGGTHCLSGHAASRFELPLESRWFAPYARTATTAQSTTVADTTAAARVRVAARGSRVWPAMTTPTARATRGGETMIANDPATFCPASVTRLSAPSPAAAPEVAAENIAAAPVLVPVR